LAALAVALTGLIGCAKSGDVSSRNSSDPIPVGAIISKTGTYASLGAVQEKVFQAEVEKINAAGGIGGRPVKLIIEDDGTDESKAVSAAQKLIERDRVVAILGSSGTGATMAIRQLVEAAGIPQISMAGGNVITGELSPNVYQTPWTNKLLISNLLKYLQTQGIAKVALVTDSGGYGKDGRAIALEEAPAYGISFVEDLTFAPGDTDMSGQVARIKASDAQAIVMWNAGKEAVTIVNQAKNAGVELPWYGGSGQARSEFVDGARNATEGFVIITGRSYVLEAWDAGTPERETMDVFYEDAEKYLGEPPDIFAGHAYDALKLFATAAEKVDSAADIDGASLLAQLDTTAGVVGYGGAFTFSATDHNGLGIDDISLFTMTDGVWTVGAPSADGADGITNVN
jgi:branched-chain amino acid transport system substrate-binding protein